MNWDHAVSWVRGVWVSVSDIGRVGSGCLEFATVQPPDSARGVETKPTQRRTKKQKGDAAGEYPGVFIGNVSGGRF